MWASVVEVFLLRTRTVHISHIIHLLLFVVVGKINLLVAVFDLAAILDFDPVCSEVLIGSIA